MNKQSVVSSGRAKGLKIKFKMDNVSRGLNGIN